MISHKPINCREKSSFSWLGCSTWKKMKIYTENLILLKAMAKLCFVNPAPTNNSPFLGKQGTVCLLSDFYKVLFYSKECKKSSQSPTPKHTRNAKFCCLFQWHQKCDWAANQLLRVEEKTFVSWDYFWISEVASPSSHRCNVCICIIHTHKYVVHTGHVFITQKSLRMDKNNTRRNKADQKARVTCTFRAALWKVPLRSEKSNVF